MGDIDKISVAAGIIILIGGIIMSAISILYVWPLAIYSVIALIVGIVILVTLKKQNYVEPIRETNKKKERLERR